MIWSPPRCGEAILLFPEFFARKNRQKYTGIFSAVVVPYTHWIRECIHEDILREFLENHRMEARAMSIFEYDQEKHIMMDRKQIFKQIKKEAKATVVVLALVIGVWCALGFGVSRLDITFFHTPLWTITGCLGTWIFSILAVWWLIKRVFRDFDLDEEEE